MVLRRLLAALAVFLCCALFTPLAQAASQRVGNLEVSDTSVDFGKILVDEVVGRYVTVTNVGNAPASIHNVSLNDGMFFRTSSFQGALGPGESTAIYVRFRPPTYAGAWSDTLNVETDQNPDADFNGATISVRLSGVAVYAYDPPQLVRVDPASGALPFSGVAVGDSATKSVTIRNSGDLPLVVQPPTFSSPVLTTPTFGAAAITLQAGASFSFDVVFTPTDPGPASVQITVQSNGGTGTFAVSGTGIGPRLSADPVVFPDTTLGDTATQTVTVTNGADPTDVKSVLIEEGATQAGSGDFRVVNPPTSIGASATVAFSFAPGAAGERSAVARFVNAKGRTLLSIPLSGRASVVRTSPRRLDFGAVRTGGSLSLEIRISNDGDQQLALDSLKVLAPAGPFSVSGDLSPLPIGATRAVTVRFAPMSDGAASGSLVLEPAGQPATTVPLTGTASAAALPLAPAPALATSSAAPTDVDTGDFDEDGKVDALIGFAASGDVRVARGLGDGGFAAPVLVGGSGAPGAMDFAVGDVDEDGHLDVVVASAAGSRVLRGAGDGSFTVSSLSLIADGAALADFNDDGRLDLVATLSTSLQLRRLTGAGDGTFTASSSSSLEGFGTGVTAGDLQRDGDMDYVATWVQATGTTGARTGINDGTGTFGGSVFSTDTSGAAIGQFDAGLIPDVTLGGKLLLNTAAPLVAGGAGGDVVRVADFDGDGRDDQITARRSDALLNLSLGNGSGGFQPAVGVGTGAVGGSEPSDLAVGDLNGDGRPDVLGALGGGQLTVLLNASSPVVSGAGKAVISELRFGSDAYVQVMNTSRTSDLSLDGWQLRFAGGRSFAFPAGVRLAPRGTALVTTPLRGAGTTWSLASQARGLSGVPAAATGAVLVDRGGAAVDAAGLTTAPARFREGAGLQLVTFRGQGAYVRKVAAGAWVDTGANAADFRALDTAAQAGDPTVLGAPRPDVPTAPTNRNDILQSSLIDPSQPQSAAPNRELVDGKLVIRRLLTNCSGGLTTGACVNADPSAPAVAVKRVRFRITDLSTVGNSPSGAILRAIPFGSSGGYTQGVQLGAPSASSGGGINATITPVAPDALLGSGLLPGASLEVEFAFTIDRGGAFRFAYDTEDDLELLPKPVAPPAAEQQVPDAQPVADKVTGTAPTPETATEAAPGASAGAAPPPAATSSKAASPPAKSASAKKSKTAKKAKCVTRSQRSKLRGKARAKAKLCAPKKRPVATSKAKR